MTMQLGALEYLLPGDDETAQFMQAKRLGLAGVEVILTRAQLQEPTGKRLKRLQAARDKSGLAIPSILLGEHNNGSIASNDPAAANAARDDLRRALDWALALGARVILVPFFAQAELLSDDDVARATAAFREMCPLAQAKGLTLCYEGTLPARTVQQMAGQVNSPAFGCYFDLANAVTWSMDTATEIRVLGRLIKQVHMKETGNRHPGLGLVDYGESARALHEIGYDGWLVLETPRAPLPLVARDVSFTRACFPALQGQPSWPRVGAFSWEFKQGQLPQLVAGFKRYGLTAVQLAGELLAEALADPTVAVSTRATLEENGIEVAALGAYRNLVAPNEAKRRANIETVKRCLEIAPLLGTAVVATETGTRHPESDWAYSPANLGRAAWEALCAALDELLPVAEGHGSVLALEGYVNNVLQNEAQWLALFEKYPTKHLQVVLDPFNYLSRHLLPAKERLTANFLNRFEHRFVLAHLKDVSAEGAEVATPEFGEGVYPHRIYLQFLRDRRPDLPVILEHLPFDHIPAAMQRVQQVLA